MNIINDINAKFSNYFKPIWDKIVQFLSRGEDYYLLYGVIALLIVIIILPGLLWYLKKHPKFFAFIIFLLGIVVAIWYFLIFKK